MVVGIRAQDCELPIGVAFKKTAQPIPASFQRVVANKLRQLMSANGVSGNIDFHSFAMVPTYEIIGKSVTPGPPKQIVYQLELTIQVANIDDGVMFASYTTELDGVGSSEGAAISNAVKQLAPKNKEVSAFISQAQQRIIQYYNNNAERILNKAHMLTQTRKYEEALCLLMQVPECTSGYDAAMEMIVEVWQARVNLEGQRLLAKAHAIWAARTDSSAAIEAANLLAQIDPESSSYEAAADLLQEIKAKVEANTPWDISLKVYDTEVSLEQQRIQAAKEVAIAYAENQKEINYTFLK